MTDEEAKVLNLRAVEAANGLQDATEKMNSVIRDFETILAKKFHVSTAIELGPWSWLRWSAIKFRLEIGRAAGRHGEFQVRELLATSRATRLCALSKFPDLYEALKAQEISK